MQTQTATKITDQVVTPVASMHPAPVGQQAVMAAPRGATTPADLLSYALQSGADLDRLEKLMDLQAKWEANEARKAYVADMAEFKKNPPVILKDKRVGYENRDGTFTGYTHATLGNVTNAIIEGLAQHGFSHSWDVKQNGGAVEVTCRITHRLGHTESVMMTAGRDDSGKKNLIQQVSSTITYLERYTLLAATGLATHDNDDDGAEAGPAESLSDKWCNAAAAAPTIRELNSIWNKGSQEINGAQDREAWTAFKDACNARKAELEAVRNGDRPSRMADIVGKHSTKKQEGNAE